MANRSNHYEAAFEAHIRALRVPCVAVDEAKRAISGSEGVKNPDFLLYPRFGPNLVVEVKGKQGKDARGRRPWENWVTTDDLDGLARWQELFGPGFRALLAFVRRVMETKGVVSDADVAAVRAAGYTDGQIAESIAYIGLATYSNYFNHVYGTPLDLPQAPAL